MASKPNVIDKNSDKYQVALKLINAILKNMNKDSIDDLIEFKDIDREDIIQKENEEILNKMEDEIFKYFDKYAMNWYRRGKTKNYILTFLRKLCKDLKLKLSYSSKDVIEIINNKKFRHTNCLYSILL